LFVRRLWLGPVLTSVITTSQEAEIRRIVAWGQSQPPKKNVVETSSQQVSLCGGVCLWSQLCGRHTRASPSLADHLMPTSEKAKTQDAPWKITKASRAPVAHACNPGYPVNKKWEGNRFGGKSFLLPCVGGQECGAESGLSEQVYDRIYLPGCVPHTQMAAPTSTSGVYIMDHG
jgi:hypothetical protein